MFNQNKNMLWKMGKLCNLKKRWQRCTIVSSIFYLAFSFFRLQTSDMIKETSLSSRHVCSWNNPRNSLSRIHSIREGHNFELEDIFQESLCSLQTLRPSTILEGSNEPLVFIDDGFEDKTHCGIGCRFMRLDMALWFAYNNDMSLHNIPKGSWEYTSASSCPSRNHECYFEPLASDPLDFWILDAKSKELISSSNAEMLKNNEKRLSVQLWSRDNLDMFRSQHNFGADWFEEHKLFAGKSGCWFAAQNLYYLLKPNKMLEEEIKNVKLQLKWRDGNRCIALHVRHGDRSKLNAHVKVSDYVAALKLLPSVRKVLLVTDDFRVIEVMKEKFPEYDWVYTNYPRNNTVNIGSAMRSGKLDPTKEALNALVNLMLASECEYFVGRANSTWYRLMIMLSYGKFGTMPPFVNVHEDWGHGGLRKWGFFGMCTLPELLKEVLNLKKKYPALIKMDPSKIY